MLTPLDLERRFGITGGNIFHGEMSLDRMFVMRSMMNPSLPKRIDPATALATLRNAYKTGFP